MCTHNVHKHPHTHTHTQERNNNSRSHLYTHTPLDSAPSTQYKYSQQLLELDKCRPAEATCSMLPDKLQHIESPIRLSIWRQSLATHPDQHFVQYILKGLENGFRIGFQYQQAQLKQCSSNMAIKDPSVVSEYLHTELSLNRLVKLSNKEADELGIHCSPIGIIPKKGKPGKWRLIVDLSSPEGASVNDGVDKEKSSLSYTSVDQEC